MLVRLNADPYDNLHARMGSDDYVTATMLRLYSDGRVEFVGAYEDLVVLRGAGARTRRAGAEGRYGHNRKPHKRPRLRPACTLVRVDVVRPGLALR